MKTADREKIVAALPFASRVAFCAFCAERCLGEARRHERAREQLAHEPLLEEGVALLWRRAEHPLEPDRARVTAIVDHVRGYEVAAKHGEGTDYTVDVALVKAVIPLFKGLALVLDPSAHDELDSVSLDGGPPNRVRIPRYVAGAINGPYQSVSLIYADHEAARAGEMAVLDVALERLLALGSAPFSRAVLDGLADWPRGEVGARYVRGIAGSHDEAD